MLEEHNSTKVYYTKEPCEMSYSSLCCFLLKSGHPILQEKILADLVSRNGGKCGDHLKMMIPVNGVSDKSSLLDLQKATTKFIAYLGHLYIVRPLFSSLAFAYLSSFAPIFNSHYFACGMYPFRFFAILSGGKAVYE